MFQDSDAQIVCYTTRAVRILKNIFIGIFVIFLVIIVTCRVDRIFFHPYIPEFSDQIRSDVTTLKFTVPKDKISCEKAGGLWKKPGPRPTEECNIPTKDAGKVCSGSKECEGVCLADLNSEDMSRGMRGKLFKTQGKCSDYIKVFGCRAYVYAGWAQVVCAD
jgi:hypothetical protein